MIERHGYAHRLALAASAVLVLCLPGGCPSPSQVGNENGGGSGNDNVVDPNNTAPEAVLSINPKSAVGPGSQVTLDASSSSDADGDELAFEWAQVDGDAGEFSAAEGANVTFEAPAVLSTTQLKLRVTVRDGRGGEDTADATVVVEVGDEFAGHAQSLAPYREELTSDEAYHLLRRAAFGATPERVAAAASAGLDATLDDLLTHRGVPGKVQDLAEAYENNVPKRWMVYLLESPNPLWERMALFWHDRFATSRRVLGDSDPDLAVVHWQMLEDNAMGNYRDFLEALTLDPLMLVWLDGANSPKEAPNENYAREFWELFTLGRDVLYDEDDIRESARAFTGITLLRQYGEQTRPIFDLIHHDESVKSIFPDRADPENYNYESVIDLTLDQPEAAEYVARNLFAFFIHDHPSDDVVRELADFLVAQDWEIRPVVRKLLGSQAMFSSDARGNQISSPVEHFVGVARTLDMHVYSEDSQGYLFDQLMYDLADAGQDLLNPPGVQGWDEDAGWLEDQWILSRVWALGRTMDYGPDHTPDVPYHLLPPPGTWDERETAGEMVDAMAAVFHLALSEEERQIYVDVLDQDGWLAFYLADPEYQPLYVAEMIRLMAMHEDVIGR